MKSNGFIVLLIFLSSMVWAQDVKLTASWSAAVPMGEMNDYVRQTSGRGFQVELEQEVIPRMSIGGLMGWQGFFNKSYTFYYNDYSAISATRRNYINS